MSTDNPVITGIGAVTPLGLNVPDTWRRMLAGESGIRRITQFDPSDLPVQIAGEVDGFDAEEVMGLKRSRRSARFSQFAVAAAREAFADAGLQPGAGIELLADTERVGVIVNTAVTGIPETEANVRGLINEGVRGVSPYYVPEMIPNMPACEVSIDLHLHGPVSASALACASGNAALLEARRLIMADEADVVIAGGTDAGITPVMFAGLANMGAMSARNDEPQKASRPFSADRDGFVYGEGAVLFVVESAAHARARGARTYGSIAGGALTADGFHISHPDPTGRQPKRAMRLALERAGALPADIDYVAAHGTATRINDAVETAAIRDVFGDAADDLLVSAVKSMVGHMIGAAGAVSAMTCLLGMRDGILPPTINLHTPDPACDLDYIPNVAREAEVKTALVNAFGFGGQNCVVVLQAPGTA
jgi:3-oxoacyl-[acyl-carrier-protein] synthase II